MQGEVLPARAYRSVPAPVPSQRGGAWPPIAAHGLLTAAEIVSTSELSAEEQARILSRPRSGRLAVSHSRLGMVFLRDQTPLRSHILEKSLRGLGPEEWLGLLNDRLFFWLDPRGLEQLLAARAVHVQHNRGLPVRRAAASPPAARSHRGAGRGRRCPGYRRPRRQRAADFGSGQFTRPACRRAALSAPAAVVLPLRASDSPGSQDCESAARSAASRG